MSLPEYSKLFETLPSKEVSQLIALESVKKPERLEELLTLFYSDDLRISQRSSHALGKIADIDCSVLYPHLRGMLDRIKKPVHNSLRRNVFRTFQYMQLPEELEGEILELGIERMRDAKEAIAVKVFAMTTCFNIVIQHKELVPELIYIIEEQYPHGSTGFKNRARKLLKKLNSRLND